MNRATVHRFWSVPITICTLVLLFNGTAINVFGTPIPTLSFNKFEADSSYVRVTARVLNIRNEPSNNAALVGQIKYGQVFLSIQEQGSWKKITSDSLTGWAFSPFLTQADPPEPTVDESSNDTQPEEITNNQQTRPEADEPPVDTSPEPETTPSPEKQTTSQPESKQEKEAESKPQPKPTPTPSSDQNNVDVDLKTSQAPPTEQPQEKQPKPIKKINLVDLSDKSLERWMTKEEIITLLGKPVHSNKKVSASFNKELLEYYTTQNQILYLYLRNDLLVSWQVHQN